MAKESGSNRSSAWEGNPYAVNGVRKEYYELPPDRKKLINGIQKRVSDLMWEYLRDKSVKLKADDHTINVQFNHRDVEHVAKDALRILSGKYFSQQSMIHIDHVLSQSEYIPTDHTSYKIRTDDRTMFFRYLDRQGRGIYFKVAYRSNPGDGKHYTLHSITDIPPS